MRIGYARVSTPDQSLAIQLEALQQSGCLKIFQEVASDRQAERQALSAALDYMRPGDTLVVWRLDRLGRSLGQLIVLMNTLHNSRLGSRVSSRQLIPPPPRANSFFRSRGRLQNSNAISYGNEPWRDWRVRGDVVGKGGGAKPSIPRRLRWRSSSMRPARASVQHICTRLGIARRTFYRDLAVHRTRQQE